MSAPSSTQITVFLNPEDEEHALYLIGESFPPTTFTIIDTQPGCQAKASSTHLDLDRQMCYTEQQWETLSFFSNE